MSTRSIAAKIFADFDFDGTETEEANRLISARGSMRLAPPGQAITSTSGILSQMTVELDNSDNRYSPLITGGALYSDIANGGMYKLPVYVTVSVDGGANYYRQFTGVAKLPRHTTLAPGQPKILRLDCRSDEERVINARLNTEIADFQTYHDDGYNESELIYDVLVNTVGLLDSELTLDNGLAVVPWFWMDEDSPIETCWQLAAAAGGRFYADKSGEFVYENRTHWLSAAVHTTSQATYGRDDFERMTLFYDDSDVASQVKIRAARRELGDSGEVWRADEIVTVPPGETYTITANLSSPLYRIDSVTYTARTPGGVNLSGSVTLTRTDYAQRVDLEFENGHATLPAVIANVVISGLTVLAGEVIEETLTTSDTSYWGNPNRKLTSMPQRFSNPWIQERSLANTLAQFVLDRQETPPLFVVLEGCQGNPQLDLGWRITVDDDELMTADDDFFVVAIDWVYTLRGGFRQSITGIRCSDVFAYAAADYFVLGTSTLGGGDRVYY